MAQDPAPGTIVRHFLSLEMEQVTQFTAPQFRPMGHATTAILTRQFGEQSNQQQTRPAGIADHVDHVDQGWFADRHTALPNQTARLSREEKDGSKVLYRS